jgi:hypothetical protein
MDDRELVLLSEHLGVCQKIPRKGVPFPVAIKALTGCRVVPFDGAVQANRQLLAQLRTAAATTVQLARRKGIVGKKDQTFRSFYLSLTDDPKITKDAFHLLIGFELEIDGRRGVYVPSAWGIWTLDCLMLQIKYEFNANNRQIYASGALLADGSGEAAVDGAVGV